MLTSHRRKSTDDGLEAVTPQDLRGQVGAARLRRHGRGLHQTFKYNHYLKVRRCEILFTDAKQWTFFIYLVDDSEGCNQKQAVRAFVVAHVHVELIQGDVFALLCVAGLDELGSHMSLHDVAFP
ncbi:hypothetical protein EYF80_006429 [Liparis tanakae]|uniref:Uncharacterized protein n=1 Tax=Liparis tanakae TaxID=230148 RepID=A0A4Z2J199_9TELE|nr:hypothetical protein EYF80_006429 [Liparis tanakae]